VRRQAGRGPVVVRLPIALKPLGRMAYHQGMRSERVNYLLVGSFVLAMLATALYVLDRLTGASGPTTRYSVVYQDVSGLGDGAVVSFEGFPVGRVSHIEPLFSPGDVAFRVHLAVRRDWPIPSDSVARLASSGLIAALSVAIEEGSATTLARPGAELPGREQANLFAVVDEAAAELRSLAREGIRPALDAVREQLRTLIEELTTLSRDELRPLLASGRSRVDQLGEMLAGSTALLQSLQEAADGLEQVLDRANVQRVTHALSRLEQASGRLNQLMAELSTTRAGVDGVLRDVHGLLADNRGEVAVSVSGLARASGQLERASGTLAERMGTIMHNLDGSARNLNEFSRQLRERPGLLFSRPAQGAEGAIP